MQVPELELLARRIINDIEGREVTGSGVEPYTDPDSASYQKMEKTMCRCQNFTSLRFQRLDDMLASIDLDPCSLCTYCWNGKE